MKLNDFISNVLLDINTGLEQAKQKTGRSYFIDTLDKKGVSFDIAVTTTNSSGTQVEGGAKAGFIEVLGAKVGGKTEDKEENSQASRIQFVIFVPTKTDKEVQVSSMYQTSDILDEL